MKNKTKVLVVGHKNPDTDSICSAIAYAHLKNQIRSAEEEYLPKRAGNISSETKFVLEKFDVPEPSFIGDVATQVKDIDMRKTEGANRNISLKQAWTLMRDLGVATMPITSQNRLEGLISVKDIATANMEIYDSRILASSRTSYRNVLETLDGKLLIGDAEQVVTSGKILIAAANPDMMESFIEEGDIVILGNRYESQLCAIEMNAGCIIVCMGAPVSITIQKLAKEKGCNVIVTPHDTYTAARLINQSTPIHYFMRSEHLVTFETDDFTREVKLVMAKVRHRDFPVLDVYGQYCGMISRRSLLDVPKKKIILVDHNERAQAPDGLEDAEILEIIDHHRLGTLETISPVFFRNQPVGCTATIVYQMYGEAQVEIEPHIAGILCAAIITDTLMFRSPTCTAEDKLAAEALAQIAHVQIEHFAEEIFQAGSNLRDKSPEEILSQDFKNFSINGSRFGVGQCTFMNNSELQEVKANLIDYLPTARQTKHLDMVFMMLTNILDESTELLCSGTGAQELAENALNVRAENQSLHLEGVVSRKKQLIPAIMGALQV